MTDPTQQTTTPTRDEAVLREIYYRAADIIRIAMGWRWEGRGRGAKRVWLADEDPIAAWCGIDAIVALTEDASHAR